MITVMYGGLSVQTLIIAVTSVTPNSSAIIIADSMKTNKFITIATVGVTSAVDTTVLQRIATTSDYSYYSTTFTSLVSLIPSMTILSTFPINSNSAREYIHHFLVISTRETKLSAYKLRNPNLI